MMTNIYPTRD